MDSTSSDLLTIRAQSGTLAGGQFFIPDGAARQLGNYRLFNPHIINIYDFDVKDGTPFLVMDYAPNDTLRRRHPRGHVIPVASVQIWQGE